MAALQAAPPIVTNTSSHWGFTLRGGMLGGILGNGLHDCRDDRSSPDFRQVLP